jgi:hypothetical protein
MLGERRVRGKENDRDHEVSDYEFHVMTSPCHGSFDALFSARFLLLIAVTITAA